MYRALRAFKRPLRARVALRVPAACAVSPIEFYYAQSPVAQGVVPEAAQAAMNGRFHAIGEHILSFEGAVDWNLAGNDYRLLCFRLNAFDFLLPLSDAYRATRRPEYVQRGFALMRDWWTHGGAHARGDKWDAYVVAQRLMNWIGFLSCHASLAEDAEQMTRWVHAQARFLARNVERHLGANHVVMEAKALAFAGVYLGKPRMAASALALMDREFSEQFLPDGGHYERSPSYHIETLQHYVETAMLLHTRADARAASWVARLGMPFAYLKRAMTPALRIPLLNDASSEYPMDAREFLACAGALFRRDDFPAPESDYAKRWIPPDWRALETKMPYSGSLFEYTGYVFARGKGGGYVCFDVGDNGPDYNQGHAHADALSVCWSVGAQDLLIDSGTYTYQPGVARNAFRATAAHNTIVIDGQNSSDVWGGFRTARRAHARVLHFYEDGDSVQCTAAHDGYAHLGVSHVRTLLFKKREHLLEIRDKLEGRPGRTHRADLRFYLSPDCAPTRLDDHSVIIHGEYAARCELPVKLERCEVSVRFGQRSATTRLHAHCEFTGKRQILTIFGGNYLDSALGNIDML